MALIHTACQTSSHIVLSELRVRSPQRQPLSAVERHFFNRFHVTSKLSGMKRLFEHPSKSNMHISSSNNHAVGVRNKYIFRKQPVNTESCRTSGTVQHLVNVCARSASSLTTNTGTRISQHGARMKWIHLSFVLFQASCLDCFSLPSITWTGTVTDGHDKDQASAGIGWPPALPNGGKLSHQRSRAYVTFRFDDYLSFVR